MHARRLCARPEVRNRADRVRDGSSRRSGHHSATSATSGKRTTGRRSNGVPGSRRGTTWCGTPSLSATERQSRLCRSRAAARRRPARRGRRSTPPAADDRGRPRRARPGRRPRSRATRLIRSRSSSHPTEPTISSTLLTPSLQAGQNACSNSSSGCAPRTSRRRSSTNAGTFAQVVGLPRRRLDSIAVALAGGRPRRPLRAVRPSPPPRARRRDRRCSSPPPSRRPSTGRAARRAGRARARAPSVAGRPWSSGPLLDAGCARAHARRRSCARVRSSRRRSAAENAAPRAGMPSAGYSG